MRFDRRASACVIDAERVRDVLSLQLLQIPLSQLVVSTSVIIIGTEIQAGFTAVNPGSKQSQVNNYMYYPQHTE